MVIQVATVAEKTLNNVQGLNNVHLCLYLAVISSNTVANAFFPIDPCSLIVLVCNFFGTIIIVQQSWPDSFYRSGAYEDCRCTLVQWTLGPEKLWSG